MKGAGDFSRALFFDDRGPVMKKNRIWLLSSALMIAAAMMPAQAQLFGPSDEEVLREKNQDDGIVALKGDLDQAKARIQELSDKIDSLTQSLAQTTGANEELTHQLSLLSDRLD